MTELFQLGDFTSHAGLPLKWKIECDAIILLQPTNPIRSKKLKSFMDS